MPAIIDRGKGVGAVFVRPYLRALRWCAIFSISGESRELLACVPGRAQLAYATREGRVIVTANVVDFIELARDAIATNTEHAGILLVPSSFRGDELQAIADAIFEALKPYHAGLHGVVLYIRR